MPKTLLDAALAYASRGWPVFPLTPHDKTPDGKLAPNGYKNATTDEATIRQWWTTRPDANIGIATGEASGLVVVDLDGPEGEEHAADLPPTPYVKTGRGYHLYFAHPGEPVKNRAKIRPGVDLRGDGGYVVAPPSIHPDGTPYAWEVSPNETRIADLPTWTREKRPTNGNGQDLGAEALLRSKLEELARAPEGQRNDTLNQAAYTAGGLIAAGRADPGIVTDLATTARAVGLSDREITATLQSGVLAGARSPIPSRPPRPATNGNGHAPALSIVPDEPPAEPARRPRFTLVQAGTFKSRPAPECLVDGIFQVDSLAALVGPWGSYKSFIALDLALSVATGTPWAGRQVKQGPAVYISAEGNAALGLRLRAWEIARQKPLENVPLYILPDAVRLMEQVQVDELLLAIGETVEDAPALVVVDTLARAMTGGDENSARDMGLLVEGAERIRKTTGAVVLFIHHPTKNGNGARGSGALPGAITTEVMVEKAANVVTLTCSKQKDMAEFEPFALTPNVVDLDTEGTTSVVLNLAGGVTRSPTQHKMLAALREISPNGEATNAEWQSAAEAAGVGRSAFQAQVKGLVASGAVKVRSEGVKRFYSLAPDPL